MTAGILSRAGVVHRLIRPQGAYTASCGEPCPTRAVVVTPAQVLVYHLPRCLNCLPAKSEFDRWLYGEAA